MRIEETIEIAASPEVVWSVTEDLERWPEWTPTVTVVTRLDDGRLEVGSAARLQQPGLPEAEWVVTAVRPGQLFSWQTRIRGIGMVATHELEPCGAGTRNLLRIELSGLVARTLWPLIRARLREALRRENAGLKRHCEAITTAC